MAARIREALMSMAEESFADFQRKLMPTVSPEAVLGVRTPKLRAYAKSLYQEGNVEGFLSDVPHQYFEENCLHGFLLEQIKDCAACLEEVDRFLPYVDNWATCDMMRPKCFKKDKALVLGAVTSWLASDHTYTVRYGIGMLMTHYLKDDFRPEYLSWVADIYSNEYYVNMMIAWYFATALAYQYEAAIPYLESHTLSVWVHNKTIQKAVESYRIMPEQKAYLRTIRRKNP